MPSLAYEIGYLLGIPIDYYAASTCPASRTSSRSRRRSQSVTPADQTTRDLQFYLAARLPYARPGRRSALRAQPAWQRRRLRPCRAPAADSHRVAQGDPQAGEHAPPARSSRRCRRSSTRISRPTRSDSWWRWPTRCRRSHRAARSSRTPSGPLHPRRARPAADRCCSCAWTRSRRSRSSIFGDKSLWLGEDPAASTGPEAVRPRPSRLAHRTCAAASSRLAAMRIYEGAPRQNYEEVLRSIGAILDQRGMREITLTRDRRRLHRPGSGTCRRRGPALERSRQRDSPRRRSSCARTTCALHGGGLARRAGRVDHARRRHPAGFYETALRVARRVCRPAAAA